MRTQEILVVKWDFDLEDFREQPVAADVAGQPHPAVGDLQRIGFVVLASQGVELLDGHLAAVRGRIHAAGQDILEYMP